MVRRAERPTPPSLTCKSLSLTLRPKPNPPTRHHALAPPPPRTIIVCRPETFVRRLRDALCSFRQTIPPLLAGEASLRHKMARRASEPHTAPDRAFFRNIGYAAAVVSGSAATVYALSSALRKRDLSALWMFDQRAAPPPEVQRELRGLIPSDDEEDRVRHRGPARLLTHQAREEDEYERLQSKMKRAMDERDVDRVQDLARRLEDLQRGRREEAYSERGRSRSRGKARDRRHSPPRKYTRCDSSDESSDDARNWGRRAQSRGRRAAPNERGRRAAPHESESSRGHGAAAHEPEEPSRGHCAAPEEPSRGHRATPHESELSRGRRSPSSCTGSGVIKSAPESGSRADKSRNAERVGLRDAERRTSAAPRAVESRALVRSTTGESQALSGRNESQAPDLAPRLQPGDLVKAMCPISKEWHNATITSVRRSGLVEVRWHNPGSTPDGKPFQRYGDVWDQNIQLVFRKSNASSPCGVSAAAPGAMSSEETSKPDENALEEAPHGLKVGDCCFARGNLLEIKWFKARLLSIRSSHPRLHIEYLATLDGQTIDLALPQPRKAHVHDEDVSAEEPANPPRAEPAKEASPAELADAVESAHKQADKQGDKQADEQAYVEEPIDEDLMCSVCSRPDDEPNMLVCDNCKKGYHIYCLHPKLDKIPEGDWSCTECTAAQSS